MSTQHDSFAVTAVKTTIINIGAWVSSMIDNVNVTKLAQWFALIYTIVQLIKALPWITAYVRAVWRGFRHGDWRTWWRIADKEEKANDTAK